MGGLFFIEIFGFRHDQELELEFECFETQSIPLGLLEMLNRSRLRCLTATKTVRRVSHTQNALNGREALRNEFSLSTSTSDEGTLQPPERRKSQSKWL